MYGTIYIERLRKRKERELYKMTSSIREHKVMKYIPKKHHDKIKWAEHSFGDWEIGLKYPYYFSATDTTQLLEPTVADLKATLRSGIAKDTEHTIWRKPEA